MTSNDRLEFTEILTGVCELYKQEVSKTFIMLYFNSLEEWSIERVRKSFNLHVKSSKFFPKPSELIDLIEGNREEKALVAWKEFREAIRHHGANNSVIFEDPKTSWIIESYGGWIKVCGMETKDLDFMRIGFLKAYNALNSDLPQKKLIGLDEWENGHGGFIDYIPKPKVIGNNDKIKLLEEGRTGVIERIVGLVKVNGFLQEQSNG